MLSVTRFANAEAIHLHSTLWVEVTSPWIPPATGCHVGK